MLDRHFVVSRKLRVRRDLFQEGRFRDWPPAWGKPVAFYSDKHGVFRVNQTGPVGGDGMTQFGRALDALNIDIICANSSQARVGLSERARRCRTVW